MRGSKALTAAAVRLLKPEAVRREIADAGCPGLYLVIQPSGAKSWAVRYRRADRSTAKLTLGLYSDHVGTGEPVAGHPLNLAEARQLAAAAMSQRARGQDPAEQHRREKRAAVATDTFPEAARRYMIEHAKVTTRTWRETARWLGLDEDEDLAPFPGGLADRWRNKRPDEITAADVYALVDEARRLGIPGLKRRRGGPSDARGTRMHAAVSSLFGWLSRHRIVTGNPAAGVYRPAPPPSRDRILEDTEIRAFWGACNTIGPPFGPCLQLMLLTGCRRGEAAGLMRSEINDEGLWTIPGSRTKNGRELRLPLPAFTRELIGGVPRIDGPHGYVFTTTGVSPISGFSRIKTRVDALAKSAKPWRVHDIRRTVASGMARAGIDLHVIERVLNHVSGSFAGIVGVYQRHKFESEMRHALAEWETLLLQIVGEKSR